MTKELLETDKEYRSLITVLPLKENPLFDAWLAAVEAFRAERESKETAFVESATESGRSSSSA